MIAVYQKKNDRLIINHRIGSTRKIKRIKINTYCVFCPILFIIDVTLDLALHLIKLSVKAYEYPCVIEGLFLCVDTAMNHHFIMDLA